MDESAAVASPLLVARPADGASAMRPWDAPAVMGLVLLSVFSLPLDLPTARFFGDGRCPGWVRVALENCEVFGHLTGTVLIAAVVWTLDTRGRHHVRALIVASLASGLAVHLTKRLVGRIRPRCVNLTSPDVWSTFTGWESAWHHDSRVQGFPSGHAASAAVAVAVLALAYPRGRLLFLTVAALVGLQRVQTLAHFPSDVFAGAALGWMCALGALRLPGCRDDRTQ